MFKVIAVKNILKSIDLSRVSDAILKQEQTNMCDLYNIGVCTKIYEKLPFFAELLLAFQTTCQLLTHQSTFGHLSSSNKSGSQKMKMSIFRNKKKQSCTTFLYFILFTHEFVTFLETVRDNDKRNEGVFIYCAIIC